ncbi:DUF975 family protein [Streptococcus halichoeri]|uniref:DUF975 family protein n=1 Tax=Streptococcus halichoeri TaxID=254785 RepID=UPI00135CC674|nr:DUF975 family protein [Streptococcus halichoeri]
MKTRAELKQEAKAALKGNWGWAIAISIIPTAVGGLGQFLGNGIADSIFPDVSAVEQVNYIENLSASALSGIAVVAVLLMLGYFGLTISSQKGFLDLIRNRRKSVLATFKYTFTVRRFTRYLLLNILIGIFTFLWTLLLIIPGIIKGYSYSQANFIQMDAFEKQEKTSITSAITKSRELMDGHKWEFFVLQLSFIGWVILAYLTFGIGFIWLTPYIGATNAAYYNQLLLEQDGVALTTSSGDRDVIPQDLAEQNEVDF